MNGAIAIAAMALLAGGLVLAALEVIDRKFGSRLWGENTTHEPNHRH